MALLHYFLLDADVVFIFEAVVRRRIPSGLVSVIDGMPHGMMFRPHRPFGRIASSRVRAEESVVPQKLAPGTLEVMPALLVKPQTIAPHD